VRGRGTGLARQETGASQGKGTPKREGNVGPRPGKLRGLGQSALRHASRVESVHVAWVSLTGYHPLSVAVKAHLSSIAGLGLPLVPIHFSRIKLVSPHKVPLCRVQGGRGRGRSTREVPDGYFENSRFS